MATEEEIRAEGRVGKEQEVLLYNIALRQDELGREPTNVLWDKIKDDPMYTELFDRELLTYQVYDHGGEGVPKVASLIVTLKGMRADRSLLALTDSLRFYSSNANVATVSKDGKVKAVRKGSCTIYALANNGVRASMNVTVK